MTTKYYSQKLALICTTNEFATNEAARVADTQALVY